LQVKILADEDVDQHIIEILRRQGFQVTSVREGVRGSPDFVVLNRATAEGALLLTEDSDFGEWVFAHKKKAVGVIYLRYKATEVYELAASLAALLKEHGDSLYGKFVVVRPNKIRIRDLP
jgi:predicted nuclease of predicted toxin-antitoxin system